MPLATPDQQHQLLLNQYMLLQQQGGARSGTSESGQAAAGAPSSSSSPSRPKKKKVKTEAGASTPSGSAAAGIAAGASGPARKGKEVHRSDCLTHMSSFWERQLEAAKQDSKNSKPVLPLARIKKIMKSDEDVRSSVVSQACEKRAGRVESGERGNLIFKNAHSNSNFRSLFFFLFFTDDQR